MIGRDFRAKRLASGSTKNSAIFGPPNAEDGGQGNTRSDNGQPSLMEAGVVRPCWQRQWGRRIAYSPPPAGQTNRQYQGNVGSSLEPEQGICVKPFDLGGFGSPALRIEDGGRKLPGPFGGLRQNLQRCRECDFVPRGSELNGSFHGLFPREKTVCSSVESGSIAQPRR